MEDNTSVGSQVAGGQRPESHHRRTQSSQSTQTGAEFSSEGPTLSTQSDKSHKPAADPREAKLLASIQKLKANVSTTEGLLSKKLREITQLQSFPASTLNEANQESMIPPSQQESASEAARNQQETSVPASMSAEDEKAALAHAHSIINRHISLLKSYNEIKNIAMGMLSLIAEKEGRRLKDVMDDRGVDERD